MNKRRSHRSTVSERSFCQYFSQPVTTAVYVASRAADAPGSLQRR